MNSIPRKFDLVLVIFLTLIVLFSLSVATYYINYWPTDSEYPYLPTAAKLFEMQHISDMHDLPLKGILRVNMHGKEALIVGIAIFQKIFHDYQSLFPNVFLLIIAVCLSSLLIFVICSRLFDRATAWVIYLLFTACFWPYLYIIMGAHPPLGMMYFLVAVYLLLKTERHKLFFVLAGFSVGLMLFSTPTAPLYLIYLAGFSFYLFFKRKEKIMTITQNLSLMAAGTVGIFFVFTLPNPGKVMADYFEFMHFSRLGNNFMLYRDYLERFFPVSSSLRGGGWLWIIKFAFLYMPIIFPLYIFSLIYLFKKSAKQRWFFILAALSLSAPLIVEATGVVQFGRNYFTWYIAIIAVIAFCFYDFKNRLPGKYKNCFWICTIIVLGIHIFWNMTVFTKDIFPSRLVSTSIYNWCRKNDVRELYVFGNHPLHRNIVQYLNNPKHEKKVAFNFIDSIQQVTSGYILIPPINGKTIYVECRYDNFYPDPVLTELYLSRKLKDFTVASFPSIATSRIWNMEEEICAYRDLILGQVTEEDRRKGYALILDAGKLQEYSSSQSR